MMLKLNFKQYGSGQPMIILHGLFGSLDNWHTLAKRWGQYFSVFVLDQRNHGASPHDSLMTYGELVRDLECFMDDQHLDTAALVGHSMGGKVAMQFASRHPERVNDLVILDIGIAKSVDRHQHILRALEQIKPEEYRQRKDVEAALINLLKTPALVQFLAKNILRRVDSSLAWKFNRQTLVDHYGDLVSALELENPFLGPTLFLRGEHSDYLPPELEPELLSSFPMAQLVTLPNAGHWLHAEQPDRVFELIKDFLGAAR